MSVKYRSNLWAGIVAVALGLILFAAIPRNIGEERGDSTQAHGVTSRTVPYAMAGLIAVCGAGLLFQSLVLKKDSVKELVPGREAVAAGYVLCLVAFAWLFRHSFVLATGGLGVATLGLLRCRKISYVFALYYIFTLSLGVRLPKIWL